MKRISTARGTLLIAGVNLVVAVASFAIDSFGKLDPYCDTLETVFSTVAFPMFFFAGWPYGARTFWLGNVWAAPLFYVLLVLNASVWGAVGVRLVHWFHRTFWIMPDQPIPYDETDLKRFVRRTIILHSILLLLLVLYLRFATLLFCEVCLQGLGGQLPLPLQFLLNHTAFLWGIRFWYAIPVWIVLLWLDARAYRHLYLAKGKQAAKWWSRIVVLTIVGVFLFSVFAFCHTLCLKWYYWGRLRT